MAAERDNILTFIIIVHLPRKRRQFSYPTTVILGIRGVDRMNMIGVTVSDALTFPTIGKIVLCHRFN